jgi:hypothetical protein
LDFGFLSLCGSWDVGLIWILVMVVPGCVARGLWRSTCSMSCAVCNVLSGLPGPAIVHSIFVTASLIPLLSLAFSSALIYFSLSFPQ